MKAGTYFIIETEQELKRAYEMFEDSFDFSLERELKDFKNDEDFRAIVKGLDGTITLEDLFYAKEEYEKIESPFRNVYGWKLVKPEYTRAVKSIISDSWFSDFFHSNMARIGCNFVESNKNNSIADLLRKAGVLYLWFEPVYEDVKLPKINSYEGEVEGKILKYGCAKLNIDWFKSTDNRSIEKLTLCSGVEINKEQISQIRKYLEEHVF